VEFQLATVRSLSNNLQLRNKFWMNTSTVKTGFQGPKVFLFLLTFTFGSAAMSGQSWSCGKPVKGGVELTASTEYSLGSAGWDLQSAPKRFGRSSCSSDNSFFFSVPVQEGNYEVKVVLGGEEESDTTVKAEARRPVLVSVKTAIGEYRAERFVVNVRRPVIAGGGEVRRKPREIGSLDWDEKTDIGVRWADASGAKY
jgi:hypothetical protein